MTLQTISGSRLLIVDDISENRDLLTRRLQRKGHVVFEAADGATALAMIASQEFDLVMLDIMMPVMDGLEVLAEIRKTHAADILPVIMVTGRSFSDDVVTALEMGANDYVTKPVDFAVIFARIQSLLARKQAQKDLVAANAKLLAANLALESEIHGRLQSEAQVQFMKHYDVVTGLGNRALLRQQLDRLLKRGAQKTSTIAVLFVGLDKFKSIRAELDPASGDNLLKMAANRLCDITGDPDMIRRVSDDEFAIMLQGISSLDEAGRLADEICEKMRSPFSVLGHDIILLASAGIAQTHEDSHDADLVLRNAHLALQGARAESRGKWRYFEAAMNEKAQTRRVLESDLRKAIGSEEFIVYYQPLFNTRQNAVTGFEALMRWKHR